MSQKYSMFSWSSLVLAEWENLPTGLVSWRSIGQAFMCWSKIRPHDSSHQWHYVQELVKPDKTGRGYDFTSIFKGLFRIVKCLERKTIFSSLQCHCVYQLYFKAVPIQDLSTNIIWTPCFIFFCLFVWRDREQDVGRQRGEGGSWSR